MSTHKNTNGHREISLTMVVLARTLNTLTLIQRTNGIVAPATNNNNGIRITIRPTHITLPMILTATPAALTSTNTRITHGKNLPLIPLTGLELLTSQTV
jgi:hypothetical protein